MSRVSANFRQADLFTSRKRILVLPSVKMKFIAQAEQEFLGTVKAVAICSCQDAEPAQVFQFRTTVSCEPEPADQLNVTKATARTFDVRFEQVHGFAVSVSFGESCFYQCGNNRPPASPSEPAITRDELVKKPPIAREES